MTLDEQEIGHVPVLMDEVLHWLEPRPGQVILDCTVGRGGHASAILPKLSPGGHYIALDVDPANLEFSRQRLQPPSDVRLSLVQSNFASARAVLDSLGVDKVDSVLADLGFASTQMSDPARGFSFAAEGPLDMRLDPTLPRTAADLVNELDEAELADILYHYGEERLSRRIARKIAEIRRQKPIESTSELSRIVREAYGRQGTKSKPGWAGRIDPATRTFMALRIAVNHELEALEQLLAALPGLVRAGGVAVIISFHSLEDRMVKHAMQAWRGEGLVQKLTGKPQTAGEMELQQNPRSRSAKLRAVRFTGHLTVASGA